MGARHGSCIIAVEFATLVKASRERLGKIVINLGAWNIGQCGYRLSDGLDRQSTAAGATLKLAGVQRRVETMLTLTGANQFMEIHPDAAAAVRSF